MKKEKILITVKTYPVLSKTYGELCCTAGFRSDGSWVRLYPLPYRKLENDQCYAKWQYIEAEIKKTEKGDTRPESYKVINIDDMTPLEKIDTGPDGTWGKRDALIFKKERLFTSMNELIKLAHENERSLAIFKPKEILGFHIETAEADYDEKIRAAVIDHMRQGNLLENSDQIDLEEEFQPVRSLPYKFSYSFIDDAGKKSRLMIADWEIGALYWHSFWRHNNEEKACADVRNKYEAEFLRSGKKDIFFFLGTTFQWHRKNALNPYIIIGVAYPPKIDDRQGILL